MADTANEAAEMDREKSQADQKPAMPAHMDPKNYPDGGWAAWLAVSGAFCCLFCSFGWINCRCSKVRHGASADSLIQALVCSKRITRNISCKICRLVLYHGSRHWRLL